MVSFYKKAKNLKAGTIVQIGLGDLLAWTLEVILTINLKSQGS